MATLLHHGPERLEAIYLDIKIYGFK